MKMDQAGNKMKTRIWKVKRYREEESTRVGKKKERNLKKRKFKGRWSKGNKRRRQKKKWEKENKRKVKGRELERKKEFFRRENLIEIEVKKKKRGGDRKKKREGKLNKC